MLEQFLSVNFIPIVGFVATAIALFMPLLLMLLQNRSNARAAILSREEIAQAESRVEREPEKAKPAWDLARITLEAYFTRNLSQINSIYWLSVVVMLVGFAVLSWGISGNHLFRHRQEMGLNQPPRRSGPSSGQISTYERADS